MIWSQDSLGNTKPCVDAVGEDFYTMTRSSSSSKVLQGLIESQQNQSASNCEAEPLPSAFLGDMEALVWTSKPELYPTLRFFTGDLKSSNRKNHTSSDFQMVTTQRF